MGVTTLVSILYNGLYLKNEQLELTDFLHAGTSYKFTQIKRCLKMLGWAWSNGCGQFGVRTQKVTVSKE